MRVPRISEVITGAEGTDSKFSQRGAQVHDLSAMQSEIVSASDYSAINETKNRKEAAERLGISPRTLRHKIQKLREED